jgi:hypothetical protein
MEIVTAKHLRKSPSLFYPTKTAKDCKKAKKKENRFTTSQMPSLLFFSCSTSATVRIPIGKPLL